MKLTGKIKRKIRNLKRRREFPVCVPAPKSIRAVEDEFIFNRWSSSVYPRRGQGEYVVDSPMNPEYWKEVK